MKRWIIVNDLKIPFSAFTNNYHTLVVWRPGNVFNRTADWVELILQYMFFIHCIPNSNLARLICNQLICWLKTFGIVFKMMIFLYLTTRRYIKSTWRVLRNIDSTRVFSVDIRYCWVLYISKFKHIIIN